MRRILVLGGLLAVLLSCGVLSWNLWQTVPAPLLLPDARAVETHWQTLDTLVVRYQTSGAPFAWRSRLARQLDRAGWLGHSYPNFGASHPPFSSIWFTHTMRIGPLL